jgi:carboxypeptidase family protein
MLVSGLLLVFLATVASQQSKSTIGSIQGIVFDGNGKPLAGATVYGLPEQNMNREVDATSDAAGRFVLSELPEGDVYVSAFKESAWYPCNFFAFFLSPGGNTPNKVAVKAGETTKGVAIQLGQRAARLNLEIMDQNGKPIEEGVALTFTRPDQPGPFSSGSTGKESFLVPAVPFRLTVEAKGFKPWRTDGLLVLKPEETRQLSIRLEPVE